MALSAALDAERCEIYSDVAGVYSADPALVAEARHLPEISYPVMQEMSMAGAKVLHAHAVQFAKEKNIAIYARSTFKPGRETVIRRLSPGTIIGVQAVVSEKQVEETLRRMAGVVDAQNAGDSDYINMAPGYQGWAFESAKQLIFRGREVPSGYTEPVLHAMRLQLKQQAFEDLIYQPVLRFA